MNASTAGEDTIFAFVQLELPGALGPPDGRYLIRERPDAPPRHVLVLRTVGAVVERHGLGWRRPGQAPPAPDPVPAPTTRATLIAPQPLGSEAAAVQWLDAARHDADARVSEALRVLNRALHAHAIAARDPRAAEVSREAALAVRLGWGAGEQVADGRWSQALELGPSRGRRRRPDPLRAQERLAALLGGRERALAAETLALRARLDLDAGRAREAALQLRAALDVGIAELEVGESSSSLGARLHELRAQRAGVDRAAAEAVAGPVSFDCAELVSHALRRLEAALQVRAIDALRSPPARDPGRRRRQDGPAPGTAPPPEH